MCWFESSLPHQVLQKEVIAMAKCGQEGHCMFEAYSPSVSRSLGRTVIRGRSYEVYFCLMCKRRVLVKAKLVRSMTEAEVRDFAQEVDANTKALNG